MGKTSTNRGCRIFVDDVREEGEAVREVLVRAAGAGDVVVVRGLDEKRARQHVVVLAHRIKDQVRIAIPG